MTIGFTEIAHDNTTYAEIDKLHILTARQVKAIEHRLNVPIGDGLMSGRYTAWRMIDGTTEKLVMEPMYHGAIRLHSPHSGW
jgi:hypothetical protein